MKRLKTVLAIGVGLLAQAGACAAGAQRPNIVFIISDDHSWTAYGRSSCGIAGTRMGRAATLATGAVAFFSAGRWTTSMGSRAA